jgi:hypothetical protein
LIVVKRLLVLLLPVLLTGCVERLLLIRSEPSGADVMVDGERRGRTPYTLTYDHYGTREVTVAKPGYRTHRKNVELNAPWWQVFPFDLITEVLLPFNFQDSVEVVIPLEKEPDAAAAFQETLRRAEEARRRAESK